MLILTRHQGESVVIGQNILCTVFYPREGDYIKLVFDAPKEIPINRYEIHQRILRQRYQEADYVELNWNETVMQRLAQHQTKGLQN